MNEATPFPELVRPEIEWFVSPQSEGARVTKIRGRMEVPLDDSPLSHAIRNHEMGHAKWSPRTKWSPRKGNTAGLPEVLVEAVEEMRINTLLMNSARIDLSALDLTMDEFRKLDFMLGQPGQMGQIARLLFLLNTWNLPAFRPRHKHVEKHLQELARQGYERLWGRGLPTFGDTLEVARFLQQQFPVPHTLDEEIMAPQYGVPDGSFPWAELVVQCADLIHDVGAEYKHSAKRRRPAREGSFIHAPHRWCSDKHIFDRRAIIPGGSLLIDVSGSMRIIKQELDTLVNHNPFGTLAIYSSHSNGKCILTVVAQRGRYADFDSVKPRLGGNNEGDYPALRWLAMQPKPRIWISDGQVTGISDTPSIGNSKQCYQFVRAHGIQQVLDIHDMMLVIEGKERPLPYPDLVGLDRLGRALGGEIG